MSVRATFTCLEDSTREDWRLIAGECESLLRRMMALPLRTVCDIE
ncbi:hypothetical protein [Dokdonella sp.]